MWRTAADLEHGDNIAYLTSPWETDTSRDGGYLAGFLDGEGFLTNTLGFAQNPGTVLDDVLRMLKVRGFNPTGRPHSGSRCWTYRLAAREQMWRLLGTVRPARLLEKMRWERHRSWSQNSSGASVIRVEDAGRRSVVALQTSSRTLITDGFFSHNCFTEYDEYIGMRVLQQDHKVSRKTLGDAADQPGNLVAACGACNQKKGVRTYDHFMSMLHPDREPDWITEGDGL